MSPYHDASLSDLKFKFVCIEGPSFVNISHKWSCNIHSVMFSVRLFIKKSCCIFSGLLYSRVDKDESVPYNQLHESMQLFQETQLLL